MLLPYVITYKELATNRWKRRLKAIALFENRRRPYRGRRHRALLTPDSNPYDGP